MNKESCLILMKIIQDKYFVISPIDEEIEVQQVK